MLAIDILGRVPDYSAAEGYSEEPGNGVFTGRATSQQSGAENYVDGRPLADNL